MSKVVLKVFTEVRLCWEQRGLICATVRMVRKGVLDREGRVRREEAYWDRNC